MIVGRLLSFWDGIFSGAMLNFQGVYSTKQGTLLHCSHQTLSHSDIFQLPILAKKQDWITEPCAFVHHCVHNTLQENVEKKLPSITFPWVFWLISWWKSKDSQHFLQRPSFLRPPKTHVPKKTPSPAGHLAHQLQGISPKSLHQALRDKKLTGWKSMVQPFHDTIIRSEKYPCWNSCWWNSTTQIDCYGRLYLEADGWSPGRFHPNTCVVFVQRGLPNRQWSMCSSKTKISVVEVIMTWRVLERWGRLIVFDLVLCYRCLGEWVGVLHAYICIPIYGHWWQTYRPWSVYTISHIEKKIKRTTFCKTQMFLREQRIFVTMFGPSSIPTSIPLSGPVHSPAGSSVRFGVHGFSSVPASKVKVTW